MTVNFNIPHIGLVVEGPGDKAALPLLLRKHLADRGIFQDVLSKPVPLKGKGAATRAGGIEGYASAAARPGATSVLIALDQDDDASRVLGPALKLRAESVVNIPIVVVVAEVDFEDWIYSSLESLALEESDWVANTRGLSELKRLLSPNSYTKTVWQPKLTARMDLGLARSRNRSLDRALTKFDKLLEHPAYEIAN